MSDLRGARVQMTLEEFAHVLVRCCFGLLRYHTARQMRFKLCMGDWSLSRFIEDTKSVSTSAHAAWRRNDKEMT